MVSSPNSVARMLYLAVASTPSELAVENLSCILQLRSFRAGVRLFLQQGLTHGCHAWPRPRPGWSGIGKNSMAALVERAVLW